MKRSSSNWLSCLILQDLHSDNNLLYYCIAENFNNDKNQFTFKSRDIYHLIEGDIIISSQDDTLMKVVNFDKRGLYLNRE